MIERLRANRSRCECIVVVAVSLRRDRRLHLFEPVPSRRRPWQPMTSAVRTLIQERLATLLDEKPILVWYDADEALADVFDGFARPGVRKIDARASVLRARRDADGVLGAVLAREPGVAAALLVYVASARPKSADDQSRDPFESFVRIGGVFGWDPADGLDSLARRAMPARSAEIDALFASSRRVTLADVEALGEAGAYPLLLRAFSTEDPVEAAARILMDPKGSARPLASAGAWAEWASMALASFGIALPSERNAAESAFARWILFSEFWLDVDGDVPPHVAAVPHADVAVRDRVYRLCDRLRGALEWRDRYAQVANAVEAELQLGMLAEGTSSWGKRDTFAAEDRAALLHVQRECLEGHFDVARDAIDVRRHSLWRREPDRLPLWNVAEQALNLLVRSRLAGVSQSRAGRPTSEHVRDYADREHGLWHVDRAHRWFERAVAECREREILADLIELARHEHLRVMGRVQSEFLDAVARDGWPPAMELQAATFASRVVPALEAGTRTAYFLLDALRYEMGHDLAAHLEQLGDVSIRAAATVVPTTTPFGMAALLPDADKDYGCIVDDDGLQPTIRGTVLPDLTARLAYLRTAYGDRVSDERLEILAEKTDAALKTIVKRGDLLVVRSEDIDKAGEGNSPLIARRLMASLLDDVAGLAKRLVTAGVQRFVFASDHGHILLNEQEGEVVREPPGTWALKKRRCRIGSAAADSDGVRILRADRLGLRGPVRDFVAATGFRMFARGHAFAHEGISLQECIVPVITLDARTQGTATKGAINVRVNYKDTRFTSRVISIRLLLETPDLFVQEAPVRLVVLAGGRHVGRVADCDVRDPSTGLLHLARGREVSVAVVIDSDFTGKDIELRVEAATGTGVVLGKLTLQNACID